MATTYSVIRYYKSDKHKSKVLLTGVSLGEAAAHCQDPDTASRTANGKEAVAHTKKYGDWFDGFIED